MDLYRLTKGGYVAFPYRAPILISKHVGLIGSRRRVSSEFQYKSICCRSENRRTKLSFAFVRFQTWFNANTPVQYTTNGKIDLCSWSAALRWRELSGSKITSWSSAFQRCVKLSDISRIDIPWGYSKMSGLSPSPPTYRIHEFYAVCWQIMSAFFSSMYCVNRFEVWEIEYVDFFSLMSSIK